MEGKFRFKLNLFDGIVLVLCLCVGAFLGYTMLKPAAPVEESGAPSTSSVEYVIRFKEMIAGYEDVLVTVRSDACSQGDSSLLLDGGFVLRANVTTYVRGEGYMASGPIVKIVREGQA